MQLCSIQCQGTADPTIIKLGHQKPLCLCLPWSSPLCCHCKWTAIGYYNQINSQILQKINLQAFPPFPGRKEINLLRNTRNVTVGLHSSKQSQETYNLETVVSIPVLLFSFLCAENRVTTVRWIKSVSLKWLETGINWNCLCWEAEWDGIRARGKGGFGRASQCACFTTREAEAQAEMWNQSREDCFLLFCFYKIIF